MAADTNNDQKSKKKLIIVIAVVAIIACCGIGIWAYVKNQDITRRTNRMLEHFDILSSPESICEAIATEEYGLFDIAGYDFVSPTGVVMENGTSSAFTKACLSRINEYRKNGDNERLNAMIIAFEHVNLNNKKVLSALNAACEETGGRIEVDPSWFTRKSVNYDSPALDGGSSNSSQKKKCSACNGTGKVRYYYGSSALDAALNGYNDYELGPCTSCNGTGYSK